MRSLSLAILFLPLAALAQLPENLFNLVTLSASAERDVSNDLLTAVLAAEFDGSDASLPVKDVNRVMQAALATARGYKSVQAKSGNYQTFPVYEKDRIVRWRVRQELRLESSDIPAASELVGKLQTSLMVAGMSLGVSPEARRQVENSLTSEALAAFEERARIVREAMREKSHRVRNLQISGGAGVRPVMAMARPVASSAPALEAGTTRITVTVSGTIQLQ